MKDYRCVIVLQSETWRTLFRCETNDNGDIVISVVDLERMIHILKTASPATRCSINIGAVENLWKSKDEEMVK